MPEIDPPGNRAAPARAAYHALAYRCIGKAHCRGRTQQAERHILEIVMCANNA